MLGMSRLTLLGLEPLPWCIARSLGQWSPFTVRLYFRQNYSGLHFCHYRVQTVWFVQGVIKAATDRYHKNVQVDWGKKCIFVPTLHFY